MSNFMALKMSGCWWAISLMIPDLEAWISRAMIQCIKCCYKLQLAATLSTIPVWGMFYLLHTKSSNVNSLNLATFVSFPPPQALKCMPSLECFLLSLPRIINYSS